MIYLTTWLLSFLACLAVCHVETRERLSRSVVVGCASIPAMTLLFHALLTMIAG